MLLYLRSTTICYYIYVQQQNLRSEWECDNGLATRPSVGKSFYGELETVLIPNLRSKLRSRRHFVKRIKKFVERRPILMFIWIGTHLDWIAGNGVHSEQLLKEHLRYVQPISV